MTTGQCSHLFCFRKVSWQQQTEDSLYRGDPEGGAATTTVRQPITSVFRHDDQIEMFHKSKLHILNFFCLVHGGSWSYMNETLKMRTNEDMRQGQSFGVFIPAFRHTGSGRDLKLPLSIIWTFHGVLLSYHIYFSNTGC